jgi:hypothetical protein
MSSARAYDFMALRRQWAAIEEDTRTPAAVAASRGPTDAPSAPPHGQPHHQQQTKYNNEGE